jgi:hypothetical protein
VLDKATLDALPAPGRNAFLIGITVPTFHADRRPQFTGSRTSPTPRSSRSAAAACEPTTTSSTACRSPNCGDEPCSTRRSKAVEEVKVQVHTYDSEMGRTGGGVFNVTQSRERTIIQGSGCLSDASVWGQSLNYFDAKTPGKTKENTGLADAYYRLYGGGAGGPIVKDRTFFLGRH